MKCGMQAALAVSVGYILGRRRKMRLASMIAIGAAVRAKIIEVGLCRVNSGLNRVDAGVGNRAGRQPIVKIGVVGRVGLRSRRLFWSKLYRFFNGS